MVQKVYKRKAYPKKKSVPKTIKTYVAKAIDKTIEDKRVAYSLPSVMNSVSTTWTELDLCSSIAAGVALGDRVGRSIRVKSVRIRGVLANGSTGTATDDPYNVMRFILGRFQSVATPLATAGATINSVLRRTDNTRNYLRQIYMDRYVPLEVTSTEKGAGDGYTPQLKHFNYFKSFKPALKLEWGDDSVTYPNNRLMFSAISDSSAIVNPGFIVGNLEVTYEDA